jgi:glycosyltransferase involved in cell wall biosynthesis
VNDLGINRIVSFCGHISRTKLPEFYQNHDVLVAPSLYESGGLSILEGFANGLPAIVLDCGGPSLSVSENCGIKIPSNLTQTETVRRLSSAIDVYVQNSDILRAHSLNSLKQVDDHYAWSNKRAKMLDVYNRLLGGFYE